MFSLRNGKSEVCLLVCLLENYSQSYPFLWFGINYHKVKKRSIHFSFRIRIQIFTTSLYLHVHSQSMVPSISYGNSSVETNKTEIYTPGLSICRIPPTNYKTSRTVRRIHDDVRFKFLYKIWPVLLVNVLMYINCNLFNLTYF